MRLPATWKPQPSNHKINRIAKIVHNIEVTWARGELAVQGESLAHREELYKGVPREHNVCSPPHNLDEGLPLQRMNYHKRKKDVRAQEGTHTSARGSVPERVQADQFGLLNGFQT